MRSVIRGLILALVPSIVPGRINAQASLPLGTRVSTSERFELHSDPWINLHHFLYHWAREKRGLGTGRQQVVVPERSSAAQLSEHERRVWETAVHSTVTRLRRAVTSMKAHWGQSRTSSFHVTYSGA